MPSLPGDITWLAVPFGIGGLIWGIASDRISARWPAHEDGAVRKIDWRTPVVAVLATLSLAAVPVRFGDAGERLVFTLFFTAGILLLATDLDQRLMPDVVTLPLIALAVVAMLWGGNSLLSKAPYWIAILTAILVPLVLFVASIPFGVGAFGGGDVKFLIGAGLLIGAVRLILSVFAAAFMSGIAIVILLATRRITLKSYIPYGPFLILGAIWVTLLPSAS